MNALLTLWQNELKLSNKALAGLIGISLSTLEKHRARGMAYLPGTLKQIADFAERHLDSLPEQRPKDVLQHLLNETAMHIREFESEHHRTQIILAIKRNALRLDLEVPAGLR